ASLITRPSPGATRFGALVAQVENLTPAYFAIVMATGTLSIAGHQLEMGWLARPLFLPNLAIYGLVLLLNVLRLARYPRRFLADLVDHQRAPGFFTWVAATCVVGSQFVLVAGIFRAAIILWGVAVVLWLAFTYTIFTAFTVKEDKPDLVHGLTGA